MWLLLDQSWWNVPRLRLPVLPMSVCIYYTVKQLSHLQLGACCTHHQHQGGPLCRWETLEASRLDSLSRDDIPWPPDQADMLQATARLATKSGCAQCGLDRAHAHQHMPLGDATYGQFSNAAYKQAFIHLSLRWHPDKFQANYGSRLPGKDQAAIMQHVCAIFQCVSSQYQSHVEAGRL